MPSPRRRYARRASGTRGSAACPRSWSRATKADAYAIQDALHPCLASGGWGAVVGYKIGCTTLVMQRYLRHSEPVRRRDFRLDRPARARALRARRLRPRRRGVRDRRPARGRPRRPGAVDHAMAASAVGACMAAIEIVDDRYVDYGVARRTDADRRRLLRRRLRARAGRARTSIHPRWPPRGRRCASTIARSAPAWAPTSWASRWRRSRGSPTTSPSAGQHLHQGDFVLLGSLVQTQWVAAGQSVVIENDRLGTARADFL